MRPRHLVRLLSITCVLVAAGNAGLAVPAAQPAATSSAAPAQREAPKVGTMENDFALDLYRRLAAGRAGENLFLSPYSIYAALAMTAEGARGATADEMGRTLHLPAALRRQGADAAARPWDFAPVHAGLGEIAAELRSGAGRVPGGEARIDSLRQALAAANAAAQKAMRQNDWKSAEEQQRVATSLSAELNALLPQVNRYELRVANALWADARDMLAPDFVRVVSAHYGTGGVRSVDYRRDPEGARATINAWVADQTEQRIRDLLPGGSVDPRTRLVLANAIWFKGEWDQVFDAAQTQEGPFRLAGGAVAQVPLMHCELGARYAAFRADGSLFPTPREVGLETRDDPADPKLYPGAGGFQLAELQYKGGQLSMAILLPHSRDGLAALERQLEVGRLSEWIGRLEQRSTNVYLPKFRLAQGRELRAPLEAMGMVRAFVDPAGGHGAQLDGMTASSNPADALFVSAVLHKAFLEVNEKGTEAAAATAVVIRVTSAMPVPKRTRPFVPMFRADRPFLFLIRDTRSGAILFMGRFAKP